MGKIIWGIIKWMLMFLGVLFLLLIALVVYLYVADPWDIKKYFNQSPVTALFSGGTESVVSDYDHPLLSADQESALKNIGINPEMIPTEITPEMEKCLIGAVGEERAREIISGSSPSPLEIFRAKSCLD